MFNFDFKEDSEEEANLSTKNLNEFQRKEVIILNFIYIKF